jgi:Circularly permutated YpsA SLOG family
MRFLPKSEYQLHQKVVSKIMSGGQTGAERGAIIWARRHEFNYGGWVPMGRKCEGGEVPAIFSRLKETTSSDYSVRAKQNIWESDGTLILTFSDKLSGGTLLTTRYCFRMEKQCFVFTLGRGLSFVRDDTMGRLQEWLSANQIEVLNITGPRESQALGLTQKTIEFLTLLVNERCRESASKEVENPLYSNR